MIADRPKNSVQREAPAVAAWPVLLIVLGSLAFIALSLVVLRAFYAWSIGQPATQPARTFAAPRLQADPTVDLAREQAAQRRRLIGYAWVDKDHGLARIPIERAMAVIAGRGERAYDPLDRVGQ